MVGLFVAIGILVFIVFAVLVAGFATESRALRIQERVETVRRSSLIVAGTQLDAELSKSIVDRLVVPALRRFRVWTMQLAPSEAIAAARKKLDRAGTSVSLTVAGFMLLRTVTVVASLAAGAGILLLWPGPMLHHLVGAGFVLLVGVLGPDYYVDSRIKTRQSTIRKALPDVIDLLVVSAEAGTGLDGALGVVTKRKQGPLVDEFNRVLIEMRLGKSRQQAWEDMADRVALDELRMLVAALRQAEQLGVSMARTLRSQADSLRTQRSLRIRQVAASLSIKMLFPLIFCILPALFIAVLGPALIDLMGAFKDLGW